MESLWNDEAIKKTWQRRSEYHIVESLAYYFDKLKDIANENYIPTDQDMLYIRTRTTGKYIICIIIYI